MLEKFIASTLVERLCILSCFDYWYLFPHRKFIVMNLLIDFHGFRLCAFLNGKGMK
jgi:hypothetical protein